MNQTQKTLALTAMVLVLLPPALVMVLQILPYLIATLGLGVACFVAWGVMAHRFNKW